MVVVGGLGGNGHCGDIWIQFDNFKVLVECKDAEYKYEHIKTAVSDCKKIGFKYALICYTSLGGADGGGHLSLPAESHRWGEPQGTGRAKQLRLGV